MDPLETHERAQAAFAAVLANIPEHRLDAPTPCTEWTVRDVVGHVVAGNTRMAGGNPSEPTDLVAAHESSAAAAQAAFAAPDGLTRMIEMPFGAVPGAVVIGFRASDVLTHAWDLARATGQPTDIEPELAEAMLASARDGVRPEFRGPGRPFADEQPCPPGRPAAEQLAAFLGRAVG